ncbi:hypothetical protein H7H52_04400 [Mycolicibacter hiberniae]|uniref:hypothetical protein n=1 Tax=Mycolicibacter hiberniae TaxID=29314 RepID=UPI0010561E35|nr:hypothetical protein [Mycolicibacter hiberniae]MCV7084978.1 hypothetical protein [Mycolicibacter hiberniae]
MWIDLLLCGIGCRGCVFGVGVFDRQGVNLSADLDVGSRYIRCDGHRRREKDSPGCVFPRGICRQDAKNPCNAGRTPIDPPLSVNADFEKRKDKSRKEAQDYYEESQIPHH